MPFQKPFAKAFLGVSLRSIQFMFVFRHRLRLLKPAWKLSIDVDNFQSCVTHKFVWFLCLERLDLIDP